MMNVNMMLIMVVIICTNDINDSDDNNYKNDINNVDDNM